MIKRFEKQLKKTDNEDPELSSSSESDESMEESSPVPVDSGELKQEELIEEKSIVTVGDLERALQGEEEEEELDDDVEEMFYQCSLCPEIKLKTLKEVDQHIEGKVHKKRELKKQLLKQKAKEKKKRRKIKE